MSGTQYTLSTPALATVQQDARDSDFPAAYIAVANDLSGRADHDTIAWFANAAQINDKNSTAFMHYFALDYTQSVVAPEGAIQQTSLLHFRKPLTILLSKH
jgi:hypothetical protein